MRQLFALALTGLLLAAPTRAAEDKAVTDGGKQIFKSSELLGSYVLNNEGETIGDVYDLVVDTKTGKVAYAAISTGGTLGFGGKLHAIPLGALNVNTSARILTWKVDKKDLDNAKGFDANNWPRQADSAWSKKDQGKNSERKEARDDAKDNNLRRLSKLVGLNMVNDRNEKLGRTYDIPVDLGAGRIAYAVFHHGGALGIGGKLFAIPWNDLQLKTADDRSRSLQFVLNVDKNYLDTNPGFNSKDWPTKAESLKTGRKESSE